MAWILHLAFFSSRVASSRLVPAVAGDDVTSLPKDTTKPKGIQVVLPSKFLFRFWLLCWPCERQLFSCHGWLWGHHLGHFLVNEIVPLLLLFRTSSHGAKAITQMLVRQTQRHFAVCFGLLLGDFLPTEPWHLPKFTMNLRANFSVCTLGTLQKTFSILHRMKGASLNGIADGNIPGSKYSTASKQTWLSPFSWGRSAALFF